MLNEKKVAVMARLAIEEKHDPRQRFITKSFWTADYLLSEFWKSFCALTVAYAAVWGLWLVAASDTWTYTYHIADVLKLAKKALIGYGFTLLLGIPVSLLTHTRHFREAFRKQQRARKYLRILERMYAEEEALENIREDNAHE